ncbi:hypothetical protein M8C21_024450 [Ambrosia artemisiifolia]|uniref:Uncharacterized protein n=1 Tax=Ambrosia artemisiifolia TaxID=4212 RepID=A0AAD5G7S1_AMBAR|nr:hypothetical protein M8C21_024450 [Ambrosia artemisiifolia]
MTGNDAGFVKQEEISFTRYQESPKGESSEWTDEKHSLYLKSMEASFVDKLYNSMDMQCWQTQNECSSDSMSSRKIHANTGSPSGQVINLKRLFLKLVACKRMTRVAVGYYRLSGSLVLFKVLRNGFWSRVDFRRDNLVRHETNIPNVSSSNPWIQHFRNGNRHACIESHSPQEKLSLTICSNTEVTDQNFDDEDSAIQLMNTACNKKRKGIYGVSESGNDQAAAASFGHFSCNQNH